MSRICEDFGNKCFILPLCIQNEGITQTQTLKSSRFGANSVDYHIPGGIGARFDANGTFITFLNPKK